MGIGAAMAGTALVGAAASDRASKRAAKSQKQASDASLDYTRQAADQARTDVNRLFPQAQQAGQAGFQGAMNVFNQAINPQMQAFQGGNVAAQNQILAGLPQVQNALLGNPVNLSGLQAYQAPQPNLSFMEQKLPYFQQQESPPPQPAFNGNLGPYQNALGGLPAEFGGDYINIGRAFSKSPAQNYTIRR